ncbi:P-loop containing nucleoside triphosphate hydrolase protein [Artomyces pyxidatus]|uniref:P-loop containing nucleoside triphosphate hydrolase protein n=1 Tax=Artomyces pyxidatus TaxID=48021 RepID=A0ACB8SHE3_9AGAM|nr:P-loop containing nucleoside triphosphate hydrolase protein [Artomyces pyxidatus]
MATTQFWKPGTLGPGSSLDRASGEEAAVVASAPISGFLSLQAQRERLPIFKHKEKLLHCVEKYPVVIVVGQTGCGKTTQIPQYLHEAGWSSDGNVIACTQPRRVAVTSVATRTATEVGSVIGEEIDEAHERSVYTDLLFAVLKKILRKRPSLRIIVSSATLDAAAFLDYFTSNASVDAATIVSLEGRAYPVEIAYLNEPTSDYVRKAAETVISQGRGDILVFLTGREEIDRCLEELMETLPSLPKNLAHLQLMALHSGLSTAEQMQVFEPSAPNSRKASVTIEGIKYVIDCGYVKIRTYDPTVGISSLTIVPTSQASAVQRAGRAGRTSSGFCYRLYPPSAFERLPHVSLPEICRTELTSPILQLKALGIDNMMKLEWLTLPPSQTIAQALSSLVTYGAMTEDGHLSLLGQKVAEIPLEVKLACMLFSSKDYQCGEEILTIAAMTAVQDIFIIPDGAAGALAELERRKFIAEEGDHLTLLNAQEVHAAVWYTD